MKVWLTLIKTILIDSKLEVNIIGDIEAAKAVMESKPIDRGNVIHSGGNISLTLDSEEMLIFGSLSYTVPPLGASLYA